MANERFAEYLEEAPKMWLQSLFEESSTQKHPLGVMRPLADGRMYVYARAGATALAPGKLCQTALTDPTNTANLVPSVANIGDRVIRLTMGDSALANVANALAEGWIYVNLHAANGAQAYKIMYHAAIAANAAGNFYLYDKIRSANIAAGNGCSLLKNKYKDILIHASVPTGAVVGVPMFSITANYYAWVQRKGPAAVLTQGTLVVGDHCIPDATTDGAVGPNANGSETEQIVGRVMQVNANAHYSLIDLDI